MVAPNITRHVTLDGRYANAEKRAAQSTRKVWRVGPNHYKVASFKTKGVVYDILVTMRGLICNCPAGWSGNVCKHAAKLSNRLRREHKSTVLFEQFYDGETDEDDWLEAIPQLPAA